MREKLNNICDLDNYTILSVVKDLPGCREARISRVLEYAHQFWTKYLMRIPGNGPHVGRVREVIDRVL